MKQRRAKDFIEAPNSWSLLLLALDVDRALATSSTSPPSTRDFDGGHNIVDDYLKRRGWRESASTRAYMIALRTSVASLYEVSDIIKDTSFRARDLVRGGNPILISERSATHSLKQWDRIVARVIQVGSQAHISGALLPYQREASKDILKLLRNVAKRTDKEMQKPTNKFGGGANHPAIVDAFSSTAMLRAAAPTITALWLIDVIDRAVDPPVLDIVPSKAMICCFALCIFRSLLTQQPITYERR